MQKITTHILLLLVLSCCQTKKQPESTDSLSKTKAIETFGGLEAKSPEFHEIISENAKIEILAEGFKWSEGPVWIPEIQSLLFTDVPENTIFKWNENDGLSTFLKPSGSTGYAISSLSEGANGLILDSQGNLLLCQHGDRRVARYTGSWSEPSPSFETIVDNLDGKKFNSPNDIIQDNAGNIYFTDPPYGLKDQDQDALKDLPFNGLYRLSRDGNLSLIDSTLTRPNGLALSPDQKKLYVANSDKKLAIWKVYDVSEEGVGNGRVFFDATDQFKTKKIGLPDGLKINKLGIIFATGPGGVLVFKSDGTHLGTILTELASANCALGEDEKTLYMTTHRYLTRISLK